MCELFGVSGKQPIVINDYLKEFVSHSKDHPNGWGIAVFYGDSVSLEKEPVKALDSQYLKERLRHEFKIKDMMAHIRLATKGGMAYENSHPFVKRDSSNRAWTLIHNGTIFECNVLDKYVHVQKGHTDSERILCYLIDQINDELSRKGRSLNREERFRIVDQLVMTISPGNKVNLMIYDGDILYVHTNCKHTLYQKKMQNSTLFCTVPLDDQEWNEVTFATLEAYRNGEKIMTGTTHDGEYIFDPEHMKYIYLDYADL